MTHNTCLNCAAPVSQNFCPNCGQKTDTHRYSIVHFIEHDFVHGVWHIEKGIFFTLKALFTRPGHSVREFIDGKRVNYYSFVGLILMILAASALLASHVHIKMADLMPQASKETASSVEKFTTENPKLVVLITVPLYSLFSFLWFRKVKLNFSEHLVMNSYRIIPELIIGLLFSVITIVYTNIAVLSFIFLGVMNLVLLLYSVWFYYQFFSAYNFTKKQLLFKSIMVTASYLLAAFVFGIVTEVVKRML